MRRAPIFLGSLLAITAGAFACEDSDSNPAPPSIGFDGGLDVSQPSADATPAPSTDVTVSIVGSAGPKAGVRVVFSDAAGAVLETKLTGADGKATSSGPIPAMASAILVNGGDHHIVTWTAIASGDVLQLRDPGNEDEPIGKYTASIPGFTGADSYEFNADGCLGFSNTSPDLSVSVSLYPSCARKPTTTFLAQAIGDEQRVLAYAFKKANPMPAAGGTLAIVPSAWSTPSDVVVSATNTPPSGIQSQLFDIIDGVAFLAGGAPLLDGSATFQSATDAREALQATVRRSDTANAFEMLARRGAPSATISFDVADTLPPVTAVSIDATDSRRPVTSWSIASSANTDGGIIRFRFQTPDGGHRWTISVPPGATSVTAPAMPAEAAASAPLGDGASTFGDPDVVFIDSPTLTPATFRSQHGLVIEIGRPTEALNIALPSEGLYKLTAHPSGD